MKKLILLILLLGGCALLPYQYNENLSASENAYYHELHNENARRALRGIEQAGHNAQAWSFRQQQLDIERTRGSGNTRTCRVDMFGTERCRYN